MAFDPYHKWFGITRAQQPPDHYRLLGIELLEADPDVIDAAAEQRMTFLRACASGAHVAESQKLLNEVAAARICLLNPQTKREYDAQLVGKRDTTPASDHRQPPVVPDRNDAELRSREALRPIVSSPPPPPPAAVQTQDAAVPAFSLPASRVPGMSFDTPDQAVDERSKLGQQRWLVKACVVAGTLLAGCGVLFFAFGRNDPGTELAEEDGPAATEESDVDAAAPEEIIVETAGGKVADESASDAVESTRPAPIPSIPIKPVPLKSGPSGAQAANSLANASIGDKATKPASPTQPAPGKPSPQSPAPQSSTGTTIAALPGKPPSSTPPVPPGSKPEQPKPEVPPSPAAPVVSNAAPVPEIETPPPPPQFSSSAERALYVRLIRELFDAGLNAESDGLKTAEQRFRTAKVITDQDPRLCYAYGLVLLKRAKTDEALLQLEAASKIPAYAYLPAWQVMVRTCIARREFMTGLGKLVQLARAVERSQTAWPDEGAKTNCAAWIGRMIGFLQRPANLSNRDIDAVARHETQIRELLSEKYRTAFDRGKAGIRAEYEQQLLASSQKREQTVKQKQEDNQRQSEQLVESQGQVQEQKEQLKMTEEKWKEWVDKETEAYDKQLRALETTFNTLSGQAEGLTSDISLLNGQIATLELAGANPTRGQLSQKIAERNNLQSRWDALDLQATGIKNQALALMAKRANAVSTYQQATGKLIQSNDTLKKWDKALNRKQKALEKSAKPSASKTPVEKAADARTRSLATWFPLNFDEEKDRVLASLAETP